MVALAEHPRVCTSTRAVTRPASARFRAIVSPRYYSIVVAPVPLLCYLRSRVDTVLITLRYDCLFFSAARVHTSPVNRQRDVSTFSQPNVGRWRGTHASTHPVDFHTISPFFFRSVCPVAISVGPPHILDSAVLISEL